MFRRCHLHLLHSQGFPSLPRHRRSAANHLQHGRGKCHSNILTLRESFFFLSRMTDDSSRTLARARLANFLKKKVCSEGAGVLTLPAVAMFFHSQTLISEAEWRPGFLAELNQSECSFPVKACGRFPRFSTLTPLFFTLFFLFFLWVS